MRNSLIGFSVLAFDQLTKYFARRQNNIVIENSGLPFGINLPGFFDTVLVLIALLIFMVAFGKAWRRDQGSRLAFVLIVAGAISNLFDRLFRGSVTDFINLKITTMNLADVAIIGGIGILCFTRFIRPQSSVSARS